MIKKINEWINKEKELGSPNPDRVVLSTIAESSVPHSRIVAVREITENGILFFTQRDTRKVEEIRHNPHVSMVLWLPLQQRQIIIEGLAHELSQDENRQYWVSLPRERQIRFAAYAPTSAQVISSVDELNNHYQRLIDHYSERDIPMSDFYRGFRVLPSVMYFYTLGLIHFSEVTRVTKINETWTEEILSP